MKLAWLLTDRLLTKSLGAQRMNVDETNRAGVHDKANRNWLVCETDFERLEYENRIAT